MAERLVMFERARQAVMAVPGVAHAALSVITPVGGSTWNSRVEVPDGPELSERERLAYVNAVSPERMRFVTHRDVGHDDCARALAAVSAICKH